jgi:hypothetical protein
LVMMSRAVVMRHSFTFDVWDRLDSFPIRGR